MQCPSSKLPCEGEGKSTGIKVAVRLPGNLHKQTTVSSLAFGALLQVMILNTQLWQYADARYADIIRLERTYIGALTYHMRGR